LIISHLLIIARLRLRYHKREPSTNCRCDDIKTLARAESSASRAAVIDDDDGDEIIGMAIQIIQQFFLWAAFGLATLLLARFALDFNRELNVTLAAPFWALVLTTLGVSLANLLGRRKQSAAAGLSNKLRALLLAAIPLGFFASSLDCTGLSLRGCTPFCTFIKIIWIPLVAILCAAVYFWPSGLLRLAITAMAFVPMVPHCLCYNVGNGWWIDRVGASPMCYVWGLAVSVVALSAITNGKNGFVSLGVALTIITGATGFFISHHYFHFPW